MASGSYRRRYNSYKEINTISQIPPRPTVAAKLLRTVGQKKEFKPSKNALVRIFVPILYVLLGIATAVIISYIVFPTPVTKTVPLHITLYSADGTTPIQQTDTVTTMTTYEPSPFVKWCIYVYTSFLAYITNVNNINILASIAGIAQGLALVIGLLKYFAKKLQKNG